MKRVINICVGLGLLVIILSACGKTAVSPNSSEPPPSSTGPLSAPSISQPPSGPPQ